MSATQTQRLAEFILNTRTSDVPSNVMDAARDALIDTVGCAVVGSVDEVGGGDAFPDGVGEKAGETLVQ